MNVIKSAIIGAGVIGNQFANMFMLPEYELSVVCDIHQEKADHLAAKYGAKGTTDIREIIDDPNIELVYIAVPPRLHLEITRPIIQAQKHVIAEKPLTVTLEEAAELVRLSNETNKICTINFPDRFSYMFQKYKAVIAEGHLGKIMDIQISMQYPDWPRAWQKTEWIDSQLDGGPTREVGSHLMFQLIDLAPYVGEVVDIRSEVLYPDKMHCETKAQATIILSSGASCTYNMLVDKSIETETRDFVVQGEKGSIQWRPKLSFQKKGSAPEPLEISPALKRPYLYFMGKEIASQILNGKQESTRLVSFEEAEKVMRIINSILYNKNLISK